MEQGVQRGAEEVQRKGEDIKTNVIHTSSGAVSALIAAYYQRKIDGMERRRADALKVCGFTQQESANMQSDIDHCEALLVKPDHPPHLVDDYQPAFKWAELPERIKRGIAYRGKCSLEALREAWGLQIEGA